MFAWGQEYLKVCNRQKLPNSEQAWHNLRRGAKVTGSTLFRALGCSTLKEQLQHYDKVCLFCVYIDTFTIPSKIGLIFKLYEFGIKIANVTNEMLPNCKGIAIYWVYRIRRFQSVHVSGN